MKVWQLRSLQLMKPASVAELTADTVVRESKGDTCRSAHLDSKVFIPLYNHLLVKSIQTQVSLLSCRYITHSCKLLQHKYMMTTMWNIKTNSFEWQTEKQWNNIFIFLFEIFSDLVFNLYFTLSAMISSQKNAHPWL